MLQSFLIGDPFFNCKSQIFETISIQNLTNCLYEMLSNFFDELGSQTFAHLPHYTM